MNALLEALEHSPRRRWLRLVGIPVATAILDVALLGGIMQAWMMSDWLRRAP